MQILIGAAVIIVILLLLGVEPILIWTGILVLAEGMLILMLLFFGVSLFLYVWFRPGRAELLRVPEAKGAVEFARYLVGEEEFRNIFPIETILVKWFYPERTERAVRYRRMGRWKLLFDHYSRLVLGLGLISSAVFGSGIGWFLGMLFGIW